MDAYESNMWKLTKLSEEDVDRVLTGRYNGDDDKLRDLTGVAREIKATLVAGPDDTTRATHLMAIGEAASNLDVKRSPAPTSAPSRSLVRRAKVVFTSLFATLIGKIALVGVAVAATTGGLAATGSLPDPAQEALTRAGEKVGIHLPASGGDSEAGVPDELPPSTEGSSAPTVLDVIRSWDDDKGCAFGHAVATAAGGKPGPCGGEQGEPNNNESKKRGKPEGAGKPEGTPEGKPEGAGRPEGTPEGRPEGADKPEGTPQGKPEGAGKPEGTPGGGSNAEERGSRNADHGGGSDGGTVGPPSDPPIGGRNGSAGGPPSSVPSGKP